MSQRGGYLLRKVGWALVTLAVVITLNFVLFRILPGTRPRRECVTRG